MGRNSKIIISEDINLFSSCVLKDNITVFVQATAILFVIFLPALLSGCHYNSRPHHSSAKIIELKDYQTIVSSGKSPLANPTNLRYDGNSHLFVYDAQKKKVLELDMGGNVIQKYGRQGRGPGEFLSVSNIFLVQNYLYVVDQVQFRISRFEVSGNLNATFNFGKEDPHALPPPAPRALEPRAENINNQPIVTTNGNVLFSAVRPGSIVNSLYKLVNWEGDFISEIGYVPEGSVFMLDYDKYKAAIDEKRVPDYYKSQAFPVNDPGNSSEYYIIYSAFPKIAKYNSSGEKLWESNIPETAELDSVTTQFYVKSGQVRGRTRLGLKKYMSGVGDEESHLYLVLGKYYNTGSKGLWIHEFSQKGKLLRRYNLISKDIGLAEIFSVDISERRIFVITKAAGIRAYSF